MWLCSDFHSSRVWLNPCPALFFLASSLIANERTLRPSLITICLIVSQLVGKLLKPRAIKHFRRSGDVTNGLNGKPSRAVIRAIVACRVLSLLLIIGLVTRSLCVPDDVSDEQLSSVSAVTSTVFRLRSDISCTLRRWLCRPLVDPPIVFNTVLHTLHFADCPFFPRRKCCQIPSDLNSS